MEATHEEAEMLVGLGYAPSWMEDIQDGDEIAIPPVSRYGDHKALKMIRVANLRSTPSYEHNEHGEVVNTTNPHRIFSFIGIDADGIPNHYSYGKGYNVWIKRAEA